MQLKSKVKRSLLWTFSDQVVIQAANLILGLYIARLLGPHVFGIVAVVLLFSNFAQLFIDLGIGAVIIQKQNTSKALYSSLFWINVAVGVILYVLIVIASPWIARFFSMPILTHVLKISGLTIIINSTIVVQSSLLTKALNFKKKVILNWASILTGYLIAIILAWNEYGVWSVVAMYLTNSVINCLLLWLTTSWFPSFRICITSLKEVYSFGLHAFGDSFLNYWSRNFDNFIIGKSLGSIQLGLYARAYALMLFPVKNLSAVLSKVFFPAFSKVQHNLPLIAANYLKIIHYLSLVTFPLLIGLSLTAKEFVLLFLGPEWSSMIAVLSVLSLVGAVQSIVTLNGVIYYSVGKTHLAFRISVLVNILLIIAFLIGVQFGILGVAWSYFIANLVLFYPVYYTAIGLIQVKFSQVFKALRTAVFASLLMAFCLIGITQFTFCTILQTFLIKLVLGAASYITSVCYLERNIIGKIISVIKSFYQSRYEESS